MVEFIAGQIDVSPGALTEYGRREQNRREHALEAQRHIGLRPADRRDLRVALSATIGAADATDQAQPIAEAMLAALRERRALLPAADTLDRVGRVARAIARRRMKASLLKGLSAERLSALDGLLVVDPAIRMTPFAWLRAPPEAPSEKNLDALLDRLRYQFDPRGLGRAASHRPVDRGPRRRALDRVEKACRPPEEQSAVARSARVRSDRTDAVHDRMAFRSGAAPAMPGRASTRARPASSSPARCSSTSAAKSATAPSRARPIAPPPSTWWSAPSSYGTRSTPPVSSITCVPEGTIYRQSCCHVSP